jgi:hypothetical protein
MVTTLFLAGAISLLAHGGDEMRIIDGKCRLPEDEVERYSRYVNFRPADGATVNLNPPRFSWPYLPDIVPESTNVPGQIFTFQISSTQDFSDVHTV